MKRQLNIGLLLVSTVVVAQYNSQNLTLDNASNAVKYKFENLQLYPIRANQDFFTSHKNLGSYLTLKEAIESKKVEITERSGGTVNSLFIENISADTVMILSGEVVKGGKQDRVIANDIILPPTGGKKDISVFCVEQGRWQTSKGGNMSFQQYFTISSSNVRKAATVNKNQQDVWKEVAETTDKNKASTSTGTLTALLGSDTFNQALKNYTDHFNKIFSNEVDVIGVVVVAGNKILGCDMFATHDMFEKQYPNLLNSYSTEAITNGKRVSVPLEEVNRYLQNIISNEALQETEVEKSGTIMKNMGRKIHISTFN